MSEREFQQINVLIPGYSIEDLPTELGEDAAASLLNAFSVAWHPALLVRSAAIPDFRQAEDNELPTGQRIVLVPQCSEDWLGHDWRDRLQENSNILLSDCTQREQWCDAIETHIGASVNDIDSDLLSDFFALGTCHLLVGLLSRRMHHFVDPDAYLLESEATAAAEAAVIGNVETAKQHLERCFECLLDCREQFYPIDCYLLDVCLPSEQSTAKELTTLIEHASNLSLVCSGQELRTHCDSVPQLATTLHAAVERGTLALLCGHRYELRSSLSSLSTTYHDLTSNITWLRSILGDTDLHWARRRFGMTSAFPAAVSLAGYASALHVALDDGLYPDREYGQLLWQAPDGTSIPAVSRIPMAIDGASSFLRFADRMTESMQEDTNAVMLLARLPEVRTPWLGDLQRAAGYAPVLGRFVTMTEFIDQTSGQASPTCFDEGEYLSPYLIQSSVLKTDAPISSPAALHLSRLKLESAAFVFAQCAVLKPAANLETQIAELESACCEEEAGRIDIDQSEQDSLDRQQDREESLEQGIESEVESAAIQFANNIPYQQSPDSGLLLLNPHPWKRRTTITWPQQLRGPSASASIAEAWTQDERLYLSADIPAGGFLWLQESGQNESVSTESAVGRPLADSLMLRNQFFEATISESTGGIASVRFHNQRSNRVSQQVSFRYESPVSCVVDGEESRSDYAMTRLTSSRIVSSGPFTASIETSCEIVDVATDQVRARFRQTTSIERNSPRLHIRIELDGLLSPPAGNPWMTYIAARFAWENEASAITRSMLGQASGFRMERFEAPDYVEVADSDQRLLIIPHGRPYHRRSGHRMLDSLLVVDGEPCKQFEFTLEFDQPFPMRAAAEAMQPIVTHITAGRIPDDSTGGAILGLSAKNVQMARTRVKQVDGTTRVFALLQESEGRPAKCRLHTARPLAAACVRSSGESEMTDLEVRDGTVAVDFNRFQVKEVELTF